MKYYNTFLLLLSLLCSCSKIDIEKKKTRNNDFYDKAFEYWKNGKVDSAFLYFNNAKKIFIEQKDSLNIGVCLLSMSIILTEEGDYLGGQETSVNAIQYFDPKDKSHYTYINSNYNNLGIANYKLKNYTNALRFYDNALDFVSKPKEKFLTLNNKAKTYEELKNYSQAIKIYNQVLEGSNNSPTEFAMSLANLALTKWKQNSNYNPVTEYLKSLNIRQREKDYLGMSFCYAKLADYYSSIGNTNLALQYSEEMFRVNQKIKSPDDKLEALYKLVKYGPIVKTKYYFGIYEKLDDSLRQKRLSTRNEFALVRYETEKHKSDSLKAQAENVEKQKNILIQNIGIGILIVSLITGYFWYRRRQKIMKQEKELEVKNTELRYVKKVHDHVANRIYQVIDEIDNRPQMHKDEVAEKLDVIYHISRDLSYENIGTLYHQQFEKELAKMFASYQSPKVTISVIGNEEKIWQNVQKTVKAEVYAVLQELMTNMSKHSRASLVQLEFQTNNQQLTIAYTDNGKGIKDFSHGNGLSNTENRIKSISGLITFDTKPNQGLKVKISFPI